MNDLFETWQSYFGPSLLITKHPKEAAKSSSPSDGNDAGPSQRQASEMSSDATLPEALRIFAARFSRSYGLLYFVACRVLGNRNEAEAAVQRCWEEASRNPPTLQHDGAFRHWLVRVLIQEALQILNSRMDARSTNPRSRAVRHRVPGGSLKRLDKLA